MVEKREDMEDTIDNNCWIACCDILGFKNRIYDFERGYGGQHLGLFYKNFYESIVNELHAHHRYHSAELPTTWFSDTFLFFARDASKDAFGRIVPVFGAFCAYAIKRGWPLRGAIGFGRVYADISRNVFLGSGLINAYQYAEQQDWVGLLITPEAEERLGALGIDLSTWPVAFAKYSVPVKQNEDGTGTSEQKLFAYRIHKHPQVIRSVETMLYKAENRQGLVPKYTQKYENTLRFFRSKP